MLSASAFQPHRHDPTPPAASLAQDATPPAPATSSAQDAAQDPLDMRSDLLAVFIKARIQCPTLLFSYILGHDKPTATAKALVRLQQANLLPPLLPAPQNNAVLQLVLLKIKEAGFQHPVELMLRCTEGQPSKASGDARLKALVDFLLPYCHPAALPQLLIRIQVTSSFIDSGIAITSDNLCFSQQFLEMRPGGTLASLLIKLSQHRVLNEAILVSLRNLRRRIFFAKTLEKMLPTKPQPGTPSALMESAIACLLDFTQEALCMTATIFDELLASKLPNAAVLSYLTAPQKNLNALQNAILALRDAHFLTEQNLQIITAHKEPLRVALALIELRKAGISLSPDDISALLEQPFPVAFVQALLALKQQGYPQQTSLYFLRKPALVDRLCVLIEKKCWNADIAKGLMEHAKPYEVASILCLCAPMPPAMLHSIFQHPCLEKLHSALWKFKMGMQLPLHPSIEYNLKNKLCLHEAPDCLADAFLCLYKEGVPYASWTAIFYEALTKNKTPLTLVSAFVYLKKADLLSAPLKQRKRKSATPGFVGLDETTPLTVALLSRSPNPLQWANLLCNGGNELPDALKERIALSENSAQEACFCLVEQLEGFSEANRAAIKDHPNPSELFVALRTLCKAAILTLQGFRWVVGQAAPRDAASALELLGSQQFTAPCFSKIENCADRTTLFKQLAQLHHVSSKITHHLKDEIIRLVLDGAGNIIISCAWALKEMRLCSTRNIKSAMEHSKQTALFQTLQLLIQLKDSPLRRKIVEEVLATQETPGITAVRALVSHAFSASGASLGPQDFLFIAFHPDVSRLLQLFIQCYNDRTLNRENFERIRARSQSLIPREAVASFSMADSAQAETGPAQKDAAGRATCGFFIWPENRSGAAPTGGTDKRFRLQ